MDIFKSLALYIPEQLAEQQNAPNAAEKSIHDKHQSESVGIRDPLITESQGGVPTVEDKRRLYGIAVKYHEQQQLELEDKAAEHAQSLQYFKAQLKKHQGGKIGIVDPVIAEPEPRVPTVEDKIRVYGLAVKYHEQQLELGDKSTDHAQSAEYFKEQIRQLQGDQPPNMVERALHKLREYL